MPRSVTTATAILALALAVSAAAAAQSVRAEGGAAWGRTVPVGDYHAVPNGQGFQGGAQGMVLLAFGKRGSPFGIRLDGVYTKNAGNDSLDAALTTALGQTTTEHVTLVGANLDATYMLRPGRGLSPYVIGGFGLYHITIAVISGDSTANDSATKPAWDLGAGLSYALGSVAPFLEIRYVAAAAVSGFPRTTFVPIVLGLRFGGGR
jgi:opacity protein-like surface antigen